MKGDSYSDMRSYNEVAMQVSNNDYVMDDINAALKCSPLPNDGFHFTTWLGNVLYQYDNKTTILYPTQYGTLIANFDKNPNLAVIANLPIQFYDLMAVVLAALLGHAFIPVIIEHRSQSKQAKYLRTYIPSIDKVFISSFHNREECLRLLDGKRREIINLFEQGLLNNTSYDILDRRISEYVTKVD
jgi:hypothetical protein